MMIMNQISIELCNVQRRCTIVFLYNILFELNSLDLSKSSETCLSDYCVVNLNCDVE